jgi:hypothetical protein
MAVNINKTKFIIFHNRVKTIDNTVTNLTYADNEPSKNNPDLIYDIERYHSNHSNTDKRAYKLLGVYLDENLSYDYHT